MLLIVGPDTVQQARDDFDWWELDNIAVKGKEKPLRIYAVHKQTKEHVEFLKNYYNGNWDVCIRDIGEYKRAAPKMSAYYECMLNRLRSGKPSNWDGIYRATSK